MEENNEIIEEQNNTEETTEQNEVIVQNEQNETVEELPNDSDPNESAENESNIVQKIELDDSEIENLADENEDLYEVPDTLEEVILKYFNKTAEFSKEQSEGTEEDSEEEVAGNDYTLQLEKIYDNTKESLENIETQTKSISEYNENNTLQSSIEDISLTNVLLLTLIVIMMFNGLLEFTRRIF